MLLAAPVFFLMSHMTTLIYSLFSSILLTFTIRHMSGGCSRMLRVASPPRLRRGPPLRLRPKCACGAIACTCAKAAEFSRAALPFEPRLLHGSMPPDAPPPASLLPAARLERMRMWAPWLCMDSHAQCHHAAPRPNRAARLPAVITGRHMPASVRRQPSTPRDAVGS